MKFMAPLRKINLLGEAHSLIDDDGDDDNGDDDNGDDDGGGDSDGDDDDDEHGEVSYDGDERCCKVSRPHCHILTSAVQRLFPHHKCTLSSLCCVYVVSVLCLCCVCVVSAL